MFDCFIKAIANSPTQSPNQRSLLHLIKTRSPHHPTNQRSPPLTQTSDRQSTKIKQ
ncbi:hypothetical protein H6F44_02605 [Pseudanabaena sp. FACHB-1277]|uniref:Uncharacterized protein n=1 Tax=Pseudanabaena cinerea FACHB-1277 TaxID=2949581 RepID=A0A926UPU6_9CYAN|nr:hypothetical protein [Pseudanabaena cinerea]MBD2149021.1 hypothetical protein [Pseudanabaena cinerea FACHB-1277]